MKNRTLADLAKLITAKIKGDPNCKITGIAALENAKEGNISFLDNSKYQKLLSKTKASAVILRKSDLEFCKTNALIIDNPYYAYAKIATEFLPTLKTPQGIHSSVIIGENCQIDSSASIAANVVINDNVIVGKNTIIEAGCVIGESSSIGNDSHLYPNVTIYHHVCLGNRVVVHSGTVIGSDGFGFANHQGNWHKVPQLGGVIIEDDVDIGANTTIDRGALKDTLIEKGVILDNQIQIAHNVTIGAHTAIAGCVAIAGSTKIGKYCMIGGAAAIGGHLDIADKVMIGGMGMITKSITKSGIYASGTGFMEINKWYKNVARFRSLDKIVKQIFNWQKEKTSHE